jgi:hypothetical protein
LYIYKNTCVTIDINRGPILCLIASLKNISVSFDDFIYGFKISMSILSKKYGFDYFSIENISNNDIILSYINDNIEPIVISPTAYFFYNLIFSKINSNKFFICC